MTRKKNLIDILESSCDIKVLKVLLSDKTTNKNIIEEMVEKLGENDENELGGMNMQ